MKIWRCPTCNAADGCCLHQAAPELLEACKQTLIDLRVARLLSEKGFDKSIARLQAAIEKAGGAS